jgi:hypothetical protein
MAYNDTIAKNIRKQIALNSGPLSIASQNISGSGVTSGSLQWIDSNTRQAVSNSGSAGNWLAVNTPQISSKNITADTYNKVLGVFQKVGIPDSVLQPLVSAASYYVAQTGADPTTLYNSSTGQLNNQFVSVYNALRHTSSQVGVVKTNSTPNWQNNPLLRGNLQEYLA